jgi:Big-like domain-containing protein
VVSATAADNVGVTGVQFLLDGGTPIGAELTLPPYSVTGDTTTTSLGGHTLSARVHDAALNDTTSATINVTVATAPALAIDATTLGDRHWRARRA